MRYLSEPLGLSTSVIEHKEHTVVTIFVQPNPYGCAFFKIDGVYGKRGSEVTVFRAGDVSWRDGTRSVRITRDGLEEVIARRVAAQRSGWLDEQAEIRRRDQAELEDALQDRRRAEAALGSVNFGLATQDVTISALEMVRADDSIALQHLLKDAPARARPLIEADDIAEGLGGLLDKLTCLAATFLEYEQREWFQRTVGS